MGLTSFLIAVVLLSFESRDQERSAFSLDVLGDRTFLIATGISVGVIYLGTTLESFQSFLDTVALDLNQWLICIVAACAVIVVTEIRKAVGRARAEASS
jgi:Ca2+-transporting ATPase